MLIYQSQPNRAYPSIAKTFVSYYYNSYEFSSQFKFKNNDQKEEAFKLNICHQNPKVEKLFRRKTDKYFNLGYLTREISSDEIYFTYGLFRSEFIDKQPGDIIFTVIDHPINQVQNLYFYMKYILKEVEKLMKEIKDRNIIAIGMVSDFYKKYNEISLNLIKKYPSVESWIDYIIDIKGDFSNDWQQIDGKVEACYSDFFTRCSFLSDKIDLYGIMDTKKNLDLSLKKLSDILNVKSIELEDYRVPRYINNINYRNNELKRIFEKDIDFFELKVKELHK